MSQIAYWLSLVAIFAVPWENTITIGGLGSIGRIVGILGGLWWLAAIAIRRRIRQPHGFHIIFFAFVLWNTLSLLWSAAPDRTLSRVTTYWQLLIFVYMLWDLYPTAQKVRAGLQAYIFGAYVTILSILNVFLSGSITRYSADGFNSNVAGIILALGIAMAWHLTFFDPDTAKNHYLKWINFAYVPLALMCILLTGSRSALMAALPTLLYILFSLQKFNTVVRIFVFTFIIGIGLALLPFAQTSVDRFGGTAAGVNDDYSNGRMEIWEKSINVFSEHPMLGVGSFAFQEAATNTTEETKVPHSFIFALLSEIGLVGFSLFITLLGISMYCSVVQPTLISRVWLVIIIGWILCASTQNLEHRKQTWLVLDLAVCSACTQRSKTPLISSASYSSNSIS